MSQVRPRYFESDVDITEILMALTFRDGFDYVPNLESVVPRPEEECGAHTIIITCCNCHLQIDIKFEPGREIATSSIVCPVCQRILMQSPERQSLWIKANER